MAHGAAAGRG